MGTSNDELLDERLNVRIRRSIEEQRNNYRRAAQERSCWHCPRLDYNRFFQVLRAAALSAMAKRGANGEFIVDDNNRELIHQMWLYVQGSDECRWDIHKGIYLGGKIGCGKTVLMTALCEVLHLVSGKIITILPANQLYKAIRDNGMARYVTCPLFIDELGREQAEVNDFGNRIRPFNQLIEMRYEAGARTFFTSNFSMETLSKDANGYGEYINERVQEMTNMVVLPGVSRRKKWEK